jgi:hypothetical protein
MFVSKVKPHSAWVCLCLVLMLPALFAQQDSGVIAGSAIDPAGAVIPGVIVKFVNAGTNQTTTLTTDQNGQFTATALKIGTYRLATVAGFKKIVEDGIEVRVQDRLQIDLHMQVGEVSETVEVAGAAPLLQTQTSSLGQVMETKSITDLPLKEGVKV